MLVDAEDAQVRVPVIVSVNENNIGPIRGNGTKRVRAKIVEDNTMKPIVTAFINVRRVAFVIMLYY